MPRKKSIKPLTKRKKNARKNPIPNAGIGIPFSKENQPSPEAKRAGWQRKKFGQEIMDNVYRYAGLSSDDIATIEENIQNLSMVERLALKYIVEAAKGDKQLLIDLLDRHIPKAPTTLALEEGSDPITQLTVKIVQNERISDSSDQGIPTDTAGVTDPQDNPA